MIINSQNHSWSLMKLWMAPMFISSFLFMQFWTGVAVADAKPDYSHLNPIAEFELTDHNGQRFRLSDHRGKVVLLFFGYLSCPDICPVTLSKLAAIYRDLDEHQKEQMLTVFITVDPQRDTAEKIAEYLNFFDINAIGLTGYTYEIDAVVEAYSGWYEQVRVKSELGYLVNHTTYVYVLDGRGRVQHLIQHNDSPKTMAKMINDSFKSLK